MCTITDKLVCPTDVRGKRMISLHSWHSWHFENFRDNNLGGPQQGWWEWDLALLHGDAWDMG